ncbi:hypothetical protein N9U55_03035 [Luminiphilus sp.]|nr:hypothetical protein [Luminiphilus sp.]MDA9722242.1 hypothetical protein [Luminiphilus sp.]
MKAFTAFIVFFVAVSASAQQKFEIKGFSWHLERDEMIEKAKSLGLGCGGDEIDPLYSAFPAVKCRVPGVDGPSALMFFADKKMWIRPSFTNTTGMTPAEIAQFLVDNKPIENMEGFYRYGQLGYKGRAADGQEVMIYPDGRIEIKKGTLGQGGPSM